MPPPPRILIVEDESLVAFNLDRRLTRLGYAVVGRVATGAEAIHCAMTLSPHVVLMDIHLHGDIDGVEAAQAIRAQKPIPIIFLSAYVDATTIARLRAAGVAEAYLRKPIVDQTLQQTLQQVL
jgi:two-component system, cell cycle sensor histidine kinase and response regulator CckA